MAQLRDSEYDADLRSVQEARRLAVACREAQRQFAHASQAEVDRVCAAMAEAVHRDAARLGQLACDETGYGVPAHKKIKIEFGSMAVWESIRDAAPAPDLDWLRKQVKFVDTQRRAGLTVYVHCRAGISRNTSRNTSCRSTSISKCTKRRSRSTCTLSSTP